MSGRAAAAARRRQSVEAWLAACWYGGARSGFWLVPFSWLFRAVAALRRSAYSRGWLPSIRVGAPVVVVGNITVGGTGKTPLVIHLATRLAAAGWRPGVVSRGYRGAGAAAPRIVAPDSDPQAVGDEPVLIARRAGCPVAVAADRVAAARALIALGVDLVISDDGLQHYRLGRDVEIAVLDGQRLLGNGRCLPAGPLREPRSRLAQVDAVIVNGTAAYPSALAMKLVASDAVALAGTERRALASFSGERVHAVAGIGNPARFFELLRSHGIEPIPHVYPNHARYTAQMLDFTEALPVMMTEKDAVKCAAFAGPRHWFVPVEVTFTDAAEQRLMQILPQR